jgi:hypothetical protein
VTRNLVTPAGTTKVSACPNAPEKVRDADDAATDGWAEKIDSPAAPKTAMNVTTRTGQTRIGA